MNITENMRLATVLRRSRYLLLDFDGPVCSVFAGYTASKVAAELRQLIARQGFQVPTKVRETDDPLEVLRYTPSLNKPDLTSEVEEVLRNMELAAIESATPTPSLSNVLRAAHRTNRTLTIVSNNSTEAILTYLTQHNLTTHFAAVIGRYSGMDPGLLKPSKHLIDEALVRIGAPHSSTVLVGDSSSDIEAAHSASIASIGYANKPGKQTELVAAHADAVVNDMATLGDMINRSPTDSGL